MTTERRLAMPSTGTLVALQSLIGAGLSIPYLIAAVHVGDGEAYSISWARWASLGFWMSMAGVNAAGFTLALWLRGQPQGEPVNRTVGLGLLAMFQVAWATLLVVAQAVGETGRTTSGIALACSAVSAGVLIRAAVARPASRVS
jgi:hypothetical protein